MHALRAARPLARVAAVLACVLAVVPGLVVAGCAGPPPGAIRVAVGLVGTYLRPQVGGPTAAQISRFRWSDLASSPLGPRSEPLLAWAGGELVELGGLKNGTSAYDGAAFNPATGRWRRIASVAGRNVGFWNAVSVWTGRQLFVTNGQFASCPMVRGGGGTRPGCWPQAGLYDPAADRWSVTTLPAQMDGLEMAAAVWTGRYVILAGVNPSHGRLGVAAYNPAAGRWQMITPLRPAGHPSRLVAMVATSTRLILWSLWDRVMPISGGFGDYAGVDVLALSRDGTWRDVTGGWPQDQQVTSPLFTGEAILVSPGQIWCGTACIPPWTSNPGYFADPAALTRKIIPAGPLGQTNPAFIWTGRVIIAVDLNADIGAHDGQGPMHPGDMALCDPATGRWLRLPAPPGYPRLATTGRFIPGSEATPPATPVWIGTGLLALTDSGRLLAFQR